MVIKVACGVYHFNPSSQTTVKKKQNTKNTKTNTADGPCPCDARAATNIAVPRRSDVDITALKYIVGAGAHGCLDDVDITALKIYHQCRIAP